MEVKLHFQSSCLQASVFFGANVECNQTGDVGVEHVDIVAMEKGLCKGTDTGESWCVSQVSF